MKISLEAAEQRAIVKALIRDIATSGLEPMDERLKSILAQQVKVLRRAGWSLETIYQAAKDLALAWDIMRGHNRLTHLAARVRAMDADRERRAHIARMAADKREWAERGIKNLALLRGVPHPNTHDYISGPQSSCAICEGPIGVHVRAMVNVEA